MPEDPIQQTRSGKIDLLPLRRRFIPLKQAAVDRDTGAFTQQAQGKDIASTSEKTRA